ncbi:Tol-Pal system protein TolR [Achromobacter anxifer]|uniref:ExbD/TolR family protein n=1 Tax=Achromobacter anxifer TaxID=1287737 RepID=UPI00155C7C18|nr:biopolymer transporter ExbD [Achromobacter anxifer]CAB5514328.1 Tol-Pal system protein TolR [Achromobacter anxifer]
MRKDFLKSQGAEINVIPLLDVLLVLVAVLLLLTPFMAKSINVDLPTTASGAVMTQDTAITFEIKLDGSVWHEGVVVTDWSTVMPRMRGATVARIFADKGAAFMAVTGVMDKLAANDIHNIQFGVKD